MRGRGPPCASPSALVTEGHCIHLLGRWLNLCHGQLLFLNGPKLYFPDKYWLAFWGFPITSVAYLTTALSFVLQRCQIPDRSCSCWWVFPYAWILGFLHVFCHLVLLKMFSTHLVYSILIALVLCEDLEKYNIYAAISAMIFPESLWVSVFLMLILRFGNELVKEISY